MSLSVVRALVCVVWLINMRITLEYQNIDYFLLGSHPFFLKRLYIPLYNNKIKNKRRLQMFLVPFGLLKFKIRIEQSFLLQPYLGRGQCLSLAFVFGFKRFLSFF